MKELIKILLVEDVATDAELIEMELESSDYDCSFSRVETKGDFIAQLENLNPDIILSDFTLPKFSALEALQIKQQIKPFTPFILVTGAQSEEIAVECIKKGADDYILKSSLTRLPTAIWNALVKKRAERENVLALEKYRNLFENSLIGMFRASAVNCRFIESNEKARSILGIEDISELKFEDFGLCDSDDNIFTHLIKGKKSTENLEVEFIRKDNNKIWLSVSANYYEKDKIIEGTFHDITKTKNTFQELENTNYELDRFVYHSSHDLRSPLRSLQGLLQAMLEEDSLDEIKAYAKLMQRSTEKLDNLIEDLLVLARNKKSEARILPINFQNELEDCLVQLSFLENYKKVRIETEVAQNTTFYSDAVRLKIILNNLVSNAVKYHNTDRHDPFILIDIQVQPEKAVISVVDNGSGIEERHLDKIFDMFYRASSSSEGSGLGLYLVKQTVDKLEGTISIQSKIKEGTSFRVEIPNKVKHEEGSIIENKATLHNA